VTLNVFNLERTINSYGQWVLRGVFLLLVATVRRIRRLNLSSFSQVSAFSICMARGRR
jgi:hypothetical protein